MKIPVFFFQFLPFIFSCVNKRYISYHKEEDIILMSKVSLQYDFYQARAEGNELMFMKGMRNRVRRMDLEKQIELRFRKK